MLYAVETLNLTKRFPVQKRYRDLLLRPFYSKEITALKDINIKARKGEIFGLLGPNGAGKTTLIKILCTLILPTSGKAFVNGLDVTKDEKKIKKIIGYVVSDERSFYWRLTGRQNLFFFAKLNNISNREASITIERLLEFMELTHDADRMFKDYSTWMRQKLAIARGLLTDPEIIFMDEPTRSLDPITAQNLRKLIKEKIVGEARKTVFISTHNLHEAEELCDRIAIIHRGEVKITGTVEEIKRKLDPNRRYVIELKNPQNGLLQSIYNLTSPGKVKVIPDGPFPCNIQIEIETTDSNGSISQVVKEIVGMGGDICSLYEKELSLEELFLGVIDTENRMAGR